MSNQLVFTSSGDVVDAAGVKSKCLAFAKRLYNELYPVHGDRMSPPSSFDPRSFDIKLNSSVRAMVSVQTGITKTNGVYRINKNMSGQVVVFLYKHSQLKKYKCFKRSEIHDVTGTLVEHLEELLHQYTELLSLCESDDAPQASSKGSDLSPGVWKITYTYQNQTATAIWRLKEGRRRNGEIRGFAVERMCVDGKFRKGWADTELYVDEDGEYYMFSEAGRIQVINFQRD